MNDNPKPPLSDLGRHVFEMATAMNRVYAASLRGFGTSGLGVPLPEHHAQVERMQEKLESFPKKKPTGGGGGGGSAAPETPLGDPVPELEEEAPRFQFKGGNRPEAV